MMVIKNRAHKPLIQGTISSYGINKYGVGGIEGKDIHSITVGEFHIFFKPEEIKQMLEQGTKLVVEYDAIETIRQELKR